MPSRLPSGISLSREAVRKGIGPSARWHLSWAMEGSRQRPLITHTFPLERINEAFQTFIHRTGGAIKVVVKL